MRFIFLILFNLLFIKIYASINGTINIVESENNLPIVLVAPIFFTNTQIVLPSEFTESIRLIIESRLNNGNNLHNYKNNKFILQPLVFNKIPLQQDYNQLFNKIRNAEPPINIKSELINKINESNVIFGRTYLLIGQLEQFSFIQYIDYIEQNDTNSYINNLLIQVRYYIISLPQNSYLGSFIATGSAGVAKIGNNLAIDYNISQLILKLFYDLKEDTINNIIFINNRYYDKYKGSLESKYP
jgi:hypothetical protein